MGSSARGRVEPWRRVLGAGCLGGLALVTVVTCVLALLGHRAAALAGLALLPVLSVLTLLLVLPGRIAAAVGRPVGGAAAGRTRGTGPARAEAEGAAVDVRSALEDLAARLDALSARTVAGQERTRVEVLDALRAERSPDRPGGV